MRHTMTSISLIVPTLCERERIGSQLTRLSELDGLAEVIVVDGRSDDGTLAEVERRVPDFPGRLLALSSERGRAVQMNHGASSATGDVLWFVHADTELPPDATKWVARAMAGPRVVAGAFKTHTVADGLPSHWWQRSARYWLRLADLRSRYTRLPYGDQAIFVRRQAFEQLGGFREIPLMEDLELSTRLSRLGAIETVPATVRVSGRRFLEHPIRDTLLVNVFPTLFRSGVSPATLANLYRDIR